MTVEWRKVVVLAEENYTSYYVVQYGIYRMPFYHLLFLTEGNCMYGERQIAVID